MQHIPVDPAQVMFLPERHALLRSWIGAAEALARRAELSGRLCFLQLLQHGILLRVQRPSALGIYYDGEWDGKLDSSGPVFVAPVKQLEVWNLEPDDVARHFALPASQARMYGAYYDETRTIFMSGDSGLSAQWQAVVLLHELSHAIDHLSGRSVTGWRTEWRARKNQYEAMCVLAAPGFRERLDSQRELAYVRMALASGEVLGWYRPSEAELSDAAIDELWGLPASNLNESAARRTFTGHAMMQRILQSSSDDRLRRLAVTPPRGGETEVRA